MSGDKAFAAARKTGELDLPAGAGTRQVLSLSKIELENRHWRISFTHIASVVDEAGAHYARARENGLGYTDAVVRGTLCKWQWKREYGLTLNPEI